MATVKITHEVSIGGVTVTNNANLTATTLSALTSFDFCVRDLSVAASNTSQVLWASGNGVTSFTAGLLVSSQDLYLELRNSLGTPEYTLIEIKAGVPYWFGAHNGGGTTERADGSALTDGTDFENIDRIEVQNEGSSAATVSLFLFN